MFLYIDPPYVGQGKALYYNYMDEDDHRTLRDAMYGIDNPWRISYDDCDLIREIYKDFSIEQVYLNHSAANKGQSKEILISPS